MVHILSASDWFLNFQITKKNNKMYYQDMSHTTLSFANLSLCLSTHTHTHTHKHSCLHRSIWKISNSLVDYRNQNIVHKCFSIQLFFGWWHQLRLPSRCTWAAKRTTKSMFVCSIYLILLQNKCSSNK